MRIEEAISSSKISKITSARTVGIDIGSRSAKGVLIADGNIYTAIIPTGFFMDETASSIMNKLLSQAGLRQDDIDFLVGTGYGRVSMKFEIPMEIVTEISCHGLGAHFLGEDIRTILDIGGQDSKAIKIDPENGQVVNFVMNDKCAAGTGRFLEKMANVLGYDADKIGDVSLTASDPSRISSQCVVFAESEVISERAKGRNVDDIAMGIYLSVARRVNNLLNRVGIEEGVLFTGGVSNNTGMRVALEKVMNVKIQNAKLNPVFAGALGAALHAQQFYAKRVKVHGTVRRSTQISLDRFREAVEQSKENYIRKTTGKKNNVAYMCAYTPIEILAAADVAHIRLFHTGTQEEVASGERMTQSVFCDLTKSIIGKFYEHDPMYEAIDKVYTFYTCDCMKKAAEAVGGNFVPTAIYNLPRMRDRANSASYFREELIAFKTDLEKLTGEKIDDEEIRRQIKLYNRARQLYREISDFRKLKFPPITSTEYQFLMTGYYYIPVEKLIDILEDIVLQLKAVPAAEGRATRLLLAGGVMAEGDSAVTDIVENKLGGYIVAEDNCTGYKLFIDDIPEDGDVYDAIVKGYLGKAPCIRMKPLEDNEELAAQIAQDYDVDGVIFYYLKFCPGYSIAKNQFHAKFKELGIPVIEVPNDYSLNDEGQLLTRLEAFVEVLDERRRADNASE